MLFVSNQLSAETIVLTPSNTVNIRTQIDDNSVRNAMQEIVRLRGENEKEIIYLVLNSPGGDVGAGLNLIRFLDTQENIKTITMFAASMASAIVEANKGERLILETGALMFHRAKIQLQGQIGNGELESELAFIKELIRILEVKNADRMDMDLEDYRTKIKDEYWIVGKQAVDKKGADRIVSIKCSPELLTKVEDLSMESFFGTISLKFNACPLFTSPIPEKKKDLKANNKGKK